MFEIWAKSLVVKRPKQKGPKQKRPKLKAHALVDKKLLVVKEPKLKMPKQKAQEHWLLSLKSTG